MFLHFLFLPLSLRTLTPEDSRAINFATRQPSDEPSAKAEDAMVMNITEILAEHRKRIRKNFAMNIRTSSFIF